MRLRPAMWIRARRFSASSTPPTERPSAQSHSAVTVVRRCRQLGDTLSTRMICLAYDETAGADDPNTFLVDVVTGAVDTVNVSGSQFMVTGDDYVIASENNSMYAGSPAGKNFTLEGMAVPEAYPR